MLAAQDRIDEQLDAMTTDDRLQMAVMGQTARLNRDRQFSIEVANAHALTAIALALPDLARKVYELSMDVRRMTNLR